jgi:hypothetical protein
MKMLNKLKTRLLTVLADWLFDNDKFIDRVVDYVAERLEADDHFIEAVIKQIEPDEIPHLDAYVEKIVDEALDSEDSERELEKAINKAVEDALSNNQLFVDDIDDFAVNVKDIIHDVITKVYGLSPKEGAR